MLLLTIIIIVSFFVLMIIHSTIEEHYQNMYRSYGSARNPIVQMDNEDFDKINELCKQLKTGISISQEDTNWLIQKVYWVYRLEDHEGKVRCRQQ